MKDWKKKNLIPDRRPDSGFGFLFLDDAGDKGQKRKDRSALIRLLRRRPGLPAAVSLALMILAALFILATQSVLATSLFCSGSRQDLARLSGEEILKRVDYNITAGNKIMIARMIIHLRRTSRTVEFKTYVQGTEKAFTEYLAPPREKGTRMLKLGNQLWMYSPMTERTIMISGHMLRQSVMGSDLSYEDMMEDPKLLNSYTAEIAGDEMIRLGEGVEGERESKIGSQGQTEPGRSWPVSSVSAPGEESSPGQPDGNPDAIYEVPKTEHDDLMVSGEKNEDRTINVRHSPEDIIPEGTEVACWMLELKARRDEVAYPRRRLWVDKERYVVLREERYARGGILLKKTEVLSLKKFGKRWVPERATFKDMLKTGSGTEFIIDSIEFDARIPEYIFTRAALK